MTFLVTGIDAYIVCFISKLVCECQCGCCIWICSGSISFPIVFFLLFQIQSPYSTGKNMKQGYKYKVLHHFLSSVIATCALLCLPSKNTLHCTHFIHNTLLYILENTNQNKVSETDRAVTQKLAQPFLLLSSCFLSIF